MGKINAESCINHFSHPHHALKLVSLQPSTLTSSKSNRTICAACTNEATGLVYVCESCNYCLHKPCSDLPQILIHKVDQMHALNLLPTPAYEEGAFQCNACGFLGTGFSYHCDECQIDLHTVCAFMCSSVKGNAHHHALELCFDLPIAYENKAFICDVCGGGGSCSKHWLYRCDLCGFDAHLNCAKMPVVKNIKSQKPQVNSLNYKRQQPQLNSLNYKSQQHVHVMNGQDAGQYLYTPRAFRPPMLEKRNDVVQTVVQSVIEGFIEGAANQIGQAMLQGALGN